MTSFQVDVQYLFVEINLSASLRYMILAYLGKVLFFPRHVHPVESSHSKRYVRV